MAYFNYHAKIKKLIEDKELVSFEIVENWNNIKPALVLYFKNDKPMPIREYRWSEYDEILNNYDFKNDEKVAEKVVGNSANLNEN